MSISNLGNGKYRVFYYVKDINTGKLRLKNKTIKGLREAKKFESSVPRLEKTQCKSKQTLNDIFLEYLNSTDSNETTKIQHKNRFEKYVYLKDKDIHSITKPDLVKWANDLKSTKKFPKVNDDVISNATYNRIINFVKSTYKYASDIYDIADITSCLKRVSTHREEKDVLTPNEFDEMIAYETNPIYYAFFYTAYWTGLRRGELKALHKDDLIEDCLYVRRSMRLDRDTEKDCLKTGERLRIVRLDEDTLNLLTPLAKRKGTYLFGDEINLSNSSLSRHLKDCLDQCNFGKHITIHNLRHSHGSVLLDSGLDLASVSKRLGHSNIYTTASVYSHELDKSGQKSVDIIGKIKHKK